ncbi:transposase InsO family protein [Thermocatellispora tengchongensis]|uniref:Transposase InsO family protein n=1 Tax=Thermocatellispora tengchongensis TaxID=1073253 RepID=A0A840PD11_9ACTN|nr:transposase InsO family protein [Thermocatellispora tengchongensis]
MPRWHKEIKRIHGEFDGTYGSPRLTAELRAVRRRVNRKRVKRVFGIAGVRLRRKVRTTVSEPSHQKVPDLLQRDFTPPAPGRRYVGDITYLPLADGGFLYLATVLDLPHAVRRAGRSRITCAPSRWPTTHAARLAVFGWITRYNTRWRHSTLDYFSPTEYEQRLLDTVLLAA